MKTDIWMPLYVKDYLASTSRLSTLEHGIYLLLLMDYWVNGSLPNDNDILLQIAKQPKENLQVISGLLSRFFKLNQNNQWVNDRSEQELLNAKERRKIAQNNGKMGGRPTKITKTKPTGYQNNNPEITSSPASSPASSQLHSAIPPIGYVPKDFQLGNHRTVASLLNYIEKLDVSDEKKKDIRISLQSAAKQPHDIWELWELIETSLHSNEKVKKMILRGA